MGQLKETEFTRFDMGTKDRYVGLSGHVSRIAIFDERWNDAIGL